MVDQQPIDPGAGLLVWSGQNAADLRGVEERMETHDI